MTPCPHFEAKECHSCTLLPIAYPEQLLQKERDLHAILEPFSSNVVWAPSVESPLFHFRNKAKMAILGSRHHLSLGVISPQGEMVDLCTCPLYPSSLQNALMLLREWLNELGLPPYCVEQRAGEGKFVIVSESFSSGELMIRFVLRSKSFLPHIQKALPLLQKALPSLRVVTVNIQPTHMAILEGEEEILLTSCVTLEDSFNEIPLSIRPKSFFQTNPFVTEHLYQNAAKLIKDLSPHLLWDLFCGVGGFALSCAPYAQNVVGIEKEPEAVKCAQRSASLLGYTHLSFGARDLSTPTWDGNDHPDVVIVNPPRRGLGEALCALLREIKPSMILYSSCNAQSLAKDLGHLGMYQPEKGQLFDMFPHTTHYETLLLLRYVGE